MTGYVVLGLEGGEGSPEPTKYVVVSEVEARSAEHACRLVADGMSDSSLAQGVTLVAVPARNWTSGRNTFRAETQRRLLRS